MKRILVICALVVMILLPVFVFQPDASVHSKPAESIILTGSASPQASYDAASPTASFSATASAQATASLAATIHAPVPPLTAQTPHASAAYRDCELPLAVPRVHAHSPNPLPRNSPAKKIAYLTFDDGPVIKGRRPEINTANLLDLLMAYHVKATFFMRGLNVITYPDVAKRVVAEGHTAGNHTWSHANPEAESGSKFAYEVKACSDAIEKTTGVRPVVFRSPYGGGLSSYDIWVLNENHLKPFGWTVETLDWAGVADDFILTRVMNGIRTGKDLIILFHDHAWSAVDKTIDLLIQNGYALDTLDHKK